MREGQSDIQETDVLITAGVGILDGMPQGQLVGMQKCKRLTTESGVPQVGVLLAVGHSRTADNVVVITSQIQSSVSLVLNGREEFLVGDIALGFQPVVMLQQLDERLKVGLVLHLIGNDALGVGIIDVFLQAFRDTLLGSVTVQRVVNAHPVDREELSLPQFLVSEHLLAQITDFDVDYAVTQLVAQGFHHHAEQFAVRIAFVRIAIDTFAKDSAMHI